jgi:acetyl-CoA synthetase
VSFFHVSSFTCITDVINVSGHRMSTAEIESALILHPGVAEVVVIAATDDVTGQAVHAFVALKPCVPHPTLMM